MSTMMVVITTASSWCFLPTSLVEGRRAERRSCGKRSDDGNKELHGGTTRGEVVVDAKQRDGGPLSNALSIAATPVEAQGSYWRDQNTTE
jgi:hypothetical protein